MSAVVFGAIAPPWWGGRPGLWTSAAGGGYALKSMSRRHRIDKRDRSGRNPRLRERYASDPEYRVKMLTRKRHLSDAARSHATQHKREARAAERERRIAAGLPVRALTLASEDERRKRRKESDAKWLAKNKDKRREVDRQWRDRNPDKVRLKGLRRRERIKRDPGKFLHARISRSVRKSLRKGKGGVSWTKIVGFSLDQLKVHIERQFVKGMSWDAYLSGEIHIDHIRPVSCFKFQSPSDQEFRECWALSNLRPMWAPDNLEKHAKRTHLL